MLLNTMDLRRVLVCNLARHVVSTLVTWATRPARSRADILATLVDQSVSYLQCRQRTDSFAIGLGDPPQRTRSQIL